MQVAVLMVNRNDGTELILRVDAQGRVTAAPGGEVNHEDAMAIADLMGALAPFVNTHLRPSSGRRVHFHREMNGRVDEK